MGVIRSSPEHQYIYMSKFAVNDRVKIKNQNIVGVIEKIVFGDYSSIYYYVKVWDDSSPSSSADFEVSESQLEIEDASIVPHDNNNSVST